MPGLPQLAGAVHDGRLVELWIGTAYGGKKDDRPPADLFPHRRGYQHRNEPAGIGQEVDRLPPERLDDRIHHSRGRRQDLHDDTAHHHPGQEVGQVADRLHDPLEVRLVDFVEQQRQDDRRRKTEDQPVDADEQGIAEDLAELRGAAEQPDEVRQTDPLAAPYAVEYSVFLERDDDPVHGAVSEDDGPDEGCGEQQEQVAGLGVPSDDRLPVCCDLGTGSPASGELQH